MHTPDRMLALLREAGALSGDDRLPLASVSDPVTRQMVRWSRTNSYFALYYTAPPTVDTWIWPNVGKLFAGGFTPTQAGQTAQSANQTWLKRNRQLAQDFGRWKASLARGG
jgi:hypothetical protein